MKGEKREELEHIIKFNHGFDCIKFECIEGSNRCYPGSSGSHFIRGLSICFVVKGEDGAVLLSISTGLLPQYDDPLKLKWKSDLEPAFLECHSKTPLYIGQELSIHECEYCNNHPCYYIGSVERAKHAMYALINGGDEALWRFMDEYYRYSLNNGECPKPVEYKMRLRGLKERIPSFAD